MTVSGKPKIFVSHGEHDQVMPVEDTSRLFVPRLARLGYDVTYHEYDGRHGVPVDVVRKGFAWAFGTPDAEGCRARFGVR